MNAADPHRTDATSRGNRGRYLGAACAVLAAWSLLAVLRLSSFSGENSVDCFYHVRMADAGPSAYMSKTFPALKMSSWSERFSDKELGFHLLLSAIRRAGSALGASGDPPFNSAELLFPLAVLAAFAYSALRFGAPLGTLAPALILLAVGSPFFTDRLLMLRPHNMFIALMALSFPILDTAKRPRDSWRPFILGFVGAWSYSNPHFLLLPAAGFALARLRQRQAWWWSHPLAVALGIVAGYTLHPQFPNTFLNWKIQCVDVLWRALGGGAGIAIGNEFKRPDWIWALKNSIPLAAAAFSFWLAWRLAKTRSAETAERRPLPEHIQALLLSTAVACLGLPLGIRAMEYAVPFALLSFCAVAAEYHRSETDFPTPFAGRRVALLGKALAVALAAAFLVFQSENYRRKRGVEPFRDLASWMEARGLPDDAFVANLVWSDFPMLLYARPDGEYLSGLDPMFSHAAFPEKTLRLERIRLGREKTSPAELAELMGTRLAFVSSRYRLYAKRLKALGCVAIYEGRDGWLFDLNAEDADGKPRKQR